MGLTSNAGHTRGQIATAAESKETEDSQGKPPTDWRTFRLSELMEFRNGVNADKAAYGKGAPFVNVLEVITKSHLVVEDIPGRVSVPANIGSLYNVERGDILFNRTSETRKEVGLASAYVGNEPILFGGFVIRGRPKTKEMDPVYSGYAFRAEAVRAQIIAKGQDSIRANLGQADLRAVLVTLPPLSEQRAIAAALSDADALVESLDSLIAKKRAIRQGAMQQLLTGKTRLPGFRGEWPVMKLGSMLSFLKHASNPRADLGEAGSIGYLHYGDIHSHPTPMLDCERTSLPSIEGSKVSEIPRLRDGDLVLVDASEDLAGIGKSVELANMAGQAVVSGLHTIVARGEPNDWAPGFKSHLQFIRAFKMFLERAATGISVYAVSKRQVAEISLPIPPVEEQREISFVLADVDSEIATLEGRRAKAGAIKQGMMQVLLTGQVRLLAPELTA